MHGINNSALRRLFMAMCILKLDRPRLEWCALGFIFVACANSRLWLDDPINTVGHVLAPRLTKFATVSPNHRAADHRMGLAADPDAVCIYAHIDAGIAADFAALADAIAVR